MAADLATLITRALTRDSEAWGALVDGYGGVVWGTLRKFTTLTEEERRDLFQDVFELLLDRGLGSFRGSSQHEFRWYLKTIALNEAKSLLRKHGRRVETLDPLLSDSGNEEGHSNLGVGVLADASAGPEDAALGQQALREFQLCFQALPLIDQQLFWMRTRGSSYEEIAGDLAVPMGTVASKYHRAKAKLEECLRGAGIL